MSFPRLAPVPGAPAVAILTAAARGEAADSMTLVGRHGPAETVASATYVLVHILEDVLDALEGPPVEEALDLLATQAGVDPTEWTVQAVIFHVATCYAGRAGPHWVTELKSPVAIRVVEVLAGLLAAAPQLVAVERRMPARDVADLYTHVTAEFLGE